MNEREIFEKALDLTDPDARAAFCDVACGEDATLRGRVEALLQSHEESGSFLKSPAQANSPTVDLTPSVALGTRVGPYKLLQKLGEGGMGEVYLAEQTEPVERRVAVKIIKAGMDSRQVIARFEAERQALAMMDHPNIAKVLDAGTTEAGRPFFVMELVKGVPITQHCDEHRLDPGQRLELFQDVCHAVQHAHQKGIIHRDIKPSNVLVAEYDDRAVPKVIDFGVAKATQQRLTEKTMFTEVGTVVGTIEYMSPEQAKLNQLDIDTRSDVYSLGVLLYELLTGETPFDRRKLRNAAFDEMLRIIREEEPSRPSIKLSTSESLPSIAANRQVEPKMLGALLHGELDWIVMKALEKNRSRRYGTATALADDIGNYLNDETVDACPPSFAYQFRKLIRRNKQVALAAGLVFTCLTIGVAATSWQAWRADRQRDRAVEAEQLAEARLAAETAARANAEEARQAEAEARIAAQTSADDRRKNLVRQYVRRGNEYVDQRDHSTALPWFIKALETDHEDPDRAAIHRLRIATTMDRCPKLVDVWDTSSNTWASDCLADARRFLTGSKRHRSAWKIGEGRVGLPIDLEGFLEVSRDGSQVLIARNDGLKLFDIETGEVKSELEDSRGSVKLATFSADGKRVAIGHLDQRLRVWDAESGEAVTPMLDERIRNLRSLGLSPNGQYLVATDKHGLILIWDLAGSAPAKRVDTLLFSGLQEEHLVVSDSRAAIPVRTHVMVVDLKKGELAYPTLKHADGVGCLRLSPNGKLLLSGSMDHTARLWELATGKPTIDGIQHGSNVNEVEFSHDGKMIVTGTTAGEVSIWSTESGKRMHPTLRHADRISDVIFSRDGRYLLTSSRDSETRVWDLAAAGSVPYMHRDGRGEMFGCEFIEEGDRDLLFVTALWERQHYAYGLEDKSVAYTVTPNQSSTTFAKLQPDLKSVVTASFCGLVTRSRLSDGFILFQRDDLRVTPQKTPSQFRDIELTSLNQPYVESRLKATSDSGGRWIVAHENYSWDTPRYSQLLAFDSRTGQRASELLTFDVPINDAVITADGSHWIGGFGLLHGETNGRVEVRSLPELKLVHTIRVDHPVRAVAVARDGKRIVVGGGRSSRPGTVGVYDLDSDTPRPVAVRHPNEVTFAMLLSGDHRVLTGSNDGTLKLWHAGTGEALAPAIRVGDRVTSVAIDPAERWVATASGPAYGYVNAMESVRLWDLRTGEPIGPPYPHPGKVTSVTVSRDGRFLASSGSGLDVVEIPREGRTLSELKALSQILTGGQLDRTETIQPVSKSSFIAQWKLLSEQYPGEFQASVEENNHWYREQFSRAEGRNDSYAALLWLDKLIEIDAGDPTLHRMKIAHLKKLNRLGETRDAVASLQQVIDLDPGTLADLAISLSTESGSLDEFNQYAMALANRAVEAAPSEPEVWRSRFHIHRCSGKVDAAISDLEKITQLQPTNFRPWYELALLKLGSEDREGYEQTCQKLSKAIPPSGTPIIEKFVSWTSALGNAKSVDWSELVRRARFAAESEPVSMSHRKNLGAALLRAGKIAEAHEELIEADRLLYAPSGTMTSSPAYTWYLLAITCGQIGLEEEANSWLDRANLWVQQLADKQSARKEHSIAWFRRITLEALKKEATQVAKDSAGIDKDNPTILLALAAVHRRQGDSDAEESAMNRTVELTAEEAWPLVARAQWHQNAGRDEAAQADYIKALQLDPNGVDVREVLPLLESRLTALRESGSNSPSLDQLDAVVDTAYRCLYTDQFPEDPSVKDLITRAEWFRRQGARDEAIADLSAAAEFATPVDGLKQLADAWCLVNQWDRAIDCYDRLLDTQPDNIYDFKIRSYCEFMLLGVERYRERCREALERFLTPQASLQHKIQVADMCSMVDGAVDDTKAILQLVRDISAANPPHPGSVQRILAKALLCDGKFEEALPMLLKIESQGIDTYRSVSRFLLAKTHHALGQSEVAAEWLRKGDALASQTLENGEFKHAHYRRKILFAQRDAHDVLGIPLPMNTVAESK